MKDGEVGIQPFEKAVAEVLQIMGFKVDTDVQLSAHQIDIYAEYFAGISHFRLAVECKDIDKPIGVADLQRFASTATLLRSRGLIDKGIMISKGGFSAAAKSAAEQYGIQCTTFRELESHLIDFSSYLQTVLEGFESSELAQTFVDPLLQDGSGEIHPAINYLTDRAVSGSELRICILGEFGTGKSTLCTALTAKLAQQSIREPGSVPIPILVPLRDYSKTSGIRELIIDVLVARHGVHLSSFDVFSRLAGSGRLLLIMDGFDEMSKSSDPTIMRRNLLEISQTVGSQAKIILTSRTEYFSSDVEARTLFNVDDTEFNLSERPRFEILRIKEWNEEQIQYYLKRSASLSARTWDTIKTTYNLRDLASRPVLLTLIARVVPLLSKSEQSISHAHLYKAFVDTILEREAIHTLEVNPSLLRATIQDLAWKMYTENTHVLRYEEITQNSALPSFIGASAFLTRDSSGNVRFSHKSFMDYFVAERIALRGMEHLQAAALSTEVQNFLNEMHAASQ